MAYRAREGIDPDAVRLAVVVQQMVDAEAAGVMFTANPANGRRDQIVISAAWGLGESVVSGTVTTDDVVVEAGTGRVLSRRTADKEVMTVYADRGTREQPVPATRRRQPVLDDRAAAELAGYGTRIAEHFGTPQDIEWARGRWRVLHPAIPADHRAARTGGRHPGHLAGALPARALLPGEHRRAAARPALAAVRRPH